MNARTTIEVSGVNLTSLTLLYEVKVFLASSLDTRSLAMATALF